MGNVPRLLKNRRWTSPHAAGVSGRIAVVSGTGYADLIRASPDLHHLLDLQWGPFHEVNHRQAGAEARQADPSLAGTTNES